jgi:hypothetical protein
MDKSAENKVSRRDFLKRIAGIGGALTVQELLYKLRIDDRKNALDLRRNKEEGTGNIYPGVIEAEMSKELFKASGHKEWIQQVVKHPVIKEIDIMALDEMDRNSSRYQKAGNTLQLFQALSYNSLRKRYKDMTPNHPEVIHTTVVSAASVINNFVLFEELGIDPTRWGQRGNISDQRWGPNGIGRKAYPHIFPGDKETRKMGKEAQGDKAMHPFNHLFLANELIYSQRNNLPSNLQVALPLRTVADIGIAVAPSLSAKVFSQVAGNLHELKGYTNPKNWPLLNDPMDIDAGFSDIFVDNDLEANYLGALCGIDLALHGDMNKIVRILNDDRLSMPTAKPDVPEDIVREFM